MLNYNQFVDEMFNVNNKIIIDFCKIKFDLIKQISIMELIGNE